MNVFLESGVSIVLGIVGSGQSKSESNYVQLLEEMFHMNKSESSSDSPNRNVNSVRIII